MSVGREAKGRVIVRHKYISARLGAGFNSTMGGHEHPSQAHHSYCPSSPISITSAILTNLSLDANNFALHYCYLTRVLNMTSNPAVIEIQQAVLEADEDLRRAQEAYYGARDVFDLPQIFHGVAQALPAAYEALHAVDAYLKDSLNAVQNVDDVAVQLDEDAVTKTQASAKFLAEVFEAVTSADEGIRMSKYEEAAGKDKHVEVLMVNILQDILVFAMPPLITEAQYTALEDSLDTISKIQPVSKITNYGSGTQVIHAGTGQQNINAGQSLPFHGSFGAIPFEFIDADALKKKNVRDKLTAILLYLRCLADFKLLHSP